MNLALAAASAVTAALAVISFRSDTCGADG